MIALSELLTIVYHHYPRGLLNIHRMHVPLGDTVYEDTEEHLRLIVAAARGRRAYPTWKAMIRRIGDKYGLQNESLSLVSGGTDPAYSARIWITDDVALSFHVSLLGPYYGIHLPGIPEEAPIARDIAGEIEAAYPSYQQIPPEIGNIVVPDIDLDGATFGEATIYICLFSKVWTWVEPLKSASEPPPQNT